MQNDFPTTIEGLKDLYAWSDMAQAQNMDALFPKEDNLRKWSIHTRIVEKDSVHILQVPFKDEEVARALLEGEVHEVITLPKNDYYIFNEDLSYKHDFSPKNTYGLPKSFARFWFYGIVGIIIASILLFFRFYNV